ncbi:SH3 domain-containing protein [Thermoanaerobacterium sp. RBIITD]|uniref:SH3 domain-containing protein n=1 Tax=Thermoanaerobacterium sp. RBIITD TaxID=1550240 RepID=UPI000BB982B0|nr:SH3 domain-containing protein [Thermoanaerobacterium sp. RBIITD]SNX53728.1 SH3 domain-containing protein [Thermoanaerobacterium sp. RBIITD]
MVKKINLLFASLLIITSIFVMPLAYGKTINNANTKNINKINITNPKDEIVEPMQFGMAIVTAPSGLNVKTGPGTNYPIKGAYSYHTILDITSFAEEDNNGTLWYPVENMDKSLSGWVDGDYIEMIGD